MKSLALALTLSFSATLPVAALESSGASTIYNSNPNHLWNRLNQTLFERKAADGKTFGLGGLEILYWPDTTNLVDGASHEKALAVMDEFINSHGEKLISDPLERALLQRDMWWLFDWSTRQHPKLDRVHWTWARRNPTAIRELQLRLATAIRRLALTTNEIAALPDNYALAKVLPDLPRGLFETNGDWVSVSINGYNPEPVAPTHLQSFYGHSAFSVMLHMPGGRKAAIDYLDKLRMFAQLEHTWVYRPNSMSFPNSPKEVLELNPEIPQFPENTEWALVRKMCVIDTDSRIQPTPITESIQVHRHLKIKRMNQLSPDAQEFFEFDFDRRHGAALGAVRQGDKDFTTVHFMGKGIDPFEQSYQNPDNEREPLDSARLPNEVLQTCSTCHHAPGIFSVLSYTGSMSFLPQEEKPVDLAPIPFTREATATIEWKQRQYDWGLLQGLWLREE